VNSPRIPRKTKAKSFLQLLQLPYLQFATSEAPTVTGLEVDLKRMVNLAAADTLTDYEGGLVFLGYSTILVPVRWVDSDGLQWHLLTEGNGKRIALWRITEEIPYRVLITSVKTLCNVPFHILALWPNANIVLGTKIMENAQLNRADVKEKKFSILLKSLSVALSSGGMGYAGPSVGAGFEIAQAQRKYDPKDQKIIDMLIDFKFEPILLYDPHVTERRAWLVPKLSVLLQAVHFYTKSKGLSYEAPFALAKADAGESAWEALKGHMHEPIEYLDTLEENIFRLSDLLKRISVNLRRLEKKPLNSGLYDRVIGYDFADLSCKPDVSLRKTEYAWTSNRQGWYFFTTRLPVLICRGLGDVIQPIIEEGAHPPPPFKTGRDQLAAPIRCLDEICKDGVGDLAVGKLDSNWEWHSPHTPFGDCHCPESIRRGQDRLPECDVTQYVFPTGDHQCRQWADAPTNKNGVVLFGKFAGKRLQKATRSQLQPGNGNSRISIRREVDLIGVEAHGALMGAEELPRESQGDANPENPQTVQLPQLLPAADSLLEERYIGRPNDLAIANPPIPPRHNVQANGIILPRIRATNFAANGNGFLNMEDEIEDELDIPILRRVSEWGLFLVWLKAIWNVSLRKHLELYFLLIVLVWYIWG